MDNRGEKTTALINDDIIVFVLSWLAQPSASFVISGTHERREATQLTTQSVPEQPCAAFLQRILAARFSDLLHTIHCVTKPLRKSNTSVLYLSTALAPV